ncbi:MAG: endonuclease III [Chloroflexi bacterium]|nr:endonuclease III [Chloroflexota bacterium]
MIQSPFRKQGGLLSQPANFRYNLIMIPLSHHEAPKPDIKKIVDLLADAYGKPEWQPDGDPLGTLVQTILSQNTSDTNSGRAFRSLRATFPRWEDVAVADPRNISERIKNGGLGDIKARRIKEALIEIKRRCGKLDLDFLLQLSVPEAREWLKELPGVGDKTANCVLLFSLGMPALPVDTHIYRVAKRLGMVEPKASVADAHRVLEKIVSPENVYAFHVLMIEHGRRTCKAQRPRCHECVLAALCPSYEVFTGNP